jgi:hypothetical protein
MDEMEEALDRLCLLFILGGVVAFAGGVADLFLGLKGVPQIEFLIGGPAAVVVGIGLRRRHLWGILVALLLCLGVTVPWGLKVASDWRRGDVDLKLILFGVFFVICDLALLCLLAAKLAELAEVPEWDGVVEEIGPGLQCRVRRRDETVHQRIALERLHNLLQCQVRRGDETVVAWVPRKIAPVLSKVVPGDLVKVAGPRRGRHRVVSFIEKRA